MDKGAGWPVTWSAIERALSASSLRQAVLANNIANAETPGFKRSYVSFEAELARALASEQALPLARRRPEHLSGLAGGALPQPAVLVDTTTSARPDGNNVDAEREASLLAENALRYEALSRQLSDRIRLLRTAITEGRR